MQFGKFLQGLQQKEAQVTRDFAAEEQKILEREMSLSRRQSSVAVQEKINQEKQERLRKESAELDMAQKLVEERLSIAQAWRPFATKRELTKGQRMALQNGMSETLFSAIEQIFKELMRQYSNKAILTENEEERKKAMYMCAGLNMGLLSIKEKVQKIDKTQERVEEKNRKEKLEKPIDVSPRSVTHLYDNPRI